MSAGKAGYVVRRAWLCVIILIALAAAGCGGGADTLDVRWAPGAPEAPELAARLTEELAKLGKDRTTADLKLVSGEDSRVLWTRFTYTGPQPPLRPDGLEVVWIEQFPGDFNQDGYVNASDLTPIGQYWDRRVEYDDPALHGGVAWVPAGDPLGDGALNWRLARVDGNHDGLISIGDITTIAQHWLEHIEGYLVTDQPVIPDFAPAPLLQAKAWRGDLPEMAVGKPVVYRAEFALSFNEWSEYADVEVGSYTWSGRYYEELEVTLSSHSLDYAVTLENYLDCLPLALFLQPYLRYTGILAPVNTAEPSGPYVLSCPAPSMGRWLAAAELEGKHPTLAAGPLDTGEGAVLAIDFSSGLYSNAPYEYSVLCWLGPNGELDRLYQLGAGLRDAALAVSPDGRIWWCGRIVDSDDDSLSEAVLVFDADGQLLNGRRFYRPEQLDVEFSRPPQLVLDSAGRCTIVSSLRGVDEPYPNFLLLRWLDANGELDRQQVLDRWYYDSYSWYKYRGLESVRCSIDGDDNLIVVGDTDWDWDDIPFVACFLPSGEQLWARRLRAYIPNSGVHSLKVDDLEILPSGDFALLCGTESSKHTTHADLCLLSATGELISCRNIDSDLQGKIHAITVDGTGQLLAAGLVEPENWSTSYVPAVTRLGLTDSAGELFALIDPEGLSIGELSEINSIDGAVWAFGDAGMGVYWQQAGHVSFAEPRYEVEVDDITLMEYEDTELTFVTEDYVPTLEDLTANAALGPAQSNAMVLRMRDF